MSLSKLSLITSDIQIPHPLGITTWSLFCSPSVWILNFHPSWRSFRISSTTVSWVSLSITYITISSALVPISAPQAVYAHSGPHLGLSASSSCRLWVLFDPHCSPSSFPVSLSDAQCTRLLTQEVVVTWISPSPSKPLSHVSAFTSTAVGWEHPLGLACCSSFFISFSWLLVWQPPTQHCPIDWPQVTSSSN